jgi:hypothetical protein
VPGSRGPYNDIRVLNSLDNPRIHGDILQRRSRIKYIIHDQWDLPFFQMRIELVGEVVCNRSETVTDTDVGANEAL